MSATRSIMGFVPRLDVVPFGEIERRKAALVEGPGGSAFLAGEAPSTATRSWAHWIHPPASSDWVVIGAEVFTAWMRAWEDKTRALSQLEPQDRASAQPGAEPALSLAAIGSEASPIVRFVSATLFDALAQGASDIHLEADGHGLGVKFRLDGVLVSAGRLESVQAAAQAVSRIKVLSELDISERRIPQDGRLSVAYRDRQIDVRVSVMPSIHGEDVVLRVLDRAPLAERLQGLSLTKLGFDEDIVARFRALCARPHGMVLVTGPTGSGKTTTLYAALEETRDSRDKIITIEDPVEYQLQGVLQIPVHEKKGLTFARGLRSILRHDPDRILVGEIRDTETAQIALQASLTGHLVYTTVHANSAFDVLGRFMQFGLDAYSLASALSGVLAQRLVRLACPHCKTSQRPTEAQFDASAVPAALRESGAFVAVGGCAACRNTGYRGRRAIGELLCVSAPVQQLIADRAPAAAIAKQAIAEGLVSLRERALALAASGQTTLEEIDRVTLLG